MTFIQKIPNNIKTQFYPDGSYYDGRILNDCRNGHGTLHFKMYDRPCVYIGGWKDDQYHGYADFIYWKPFGEKILKVHYIGGMRNGEANGQGTLTWVDDDIQVVGYWTDSKCLHGKIITKTSSYFGDIGENRYPHGFGKITNADGTVTEGDFF
jgi:hypothetical protein